MKRWLALGLLALLGLPALAADNATLITPCGTGCVTVRAKDVGLGVQSPVYILGDTSGNPIYGTAGTANANILTVQGIASMTAIKTDGSGVTQPVSGTITANQGSPPWTIQGDSASGAANAGNPVKGGGVFNTTQPTVTTGQTVDAQYTARGAAIVATGVDAFSATVSGTVTANQGGAPWSQNVTQIAGSSVSTASTGTQKVGITGNTGAALDAAGQNAASPANELLTACQFNTTPTTITSGNVSPTQCDSGGKLLVNTGTVTVTGTVTANQGTSPWTDNVSQFGGTNISTGTGAGGAGIPRVTVSNDSKVQPWDGTNTETVKAASTNAATTDTAVVVAPSPNPSTMCPNVIPVNQTGSTDLKTSTNKLHICAMLVVSATAQNVSLVEGTGSVCATGTAALMGGTSADATHGMALAANGGFSHTADRAFIVTQTTADHLCLLQSGAGLVSGFISYVDHN